MLSYFHLLKNGTKIMIIKSLSLILLFGISFIFGFMPFFISFCRNNHKFLNFSNAFSAGIFLAMGLFHILPESAEMMKKASDLPLAYIISFLSYSLILFIEKVAFNSHSLLHKEENFNENNSNIEQNLKQTEYNNEINESKVNIEIEKKDPIFLVNKNENSNQEISSLKFYSPGDVSQEINLVNHQIKHGKKLKSKGFSAYFLLIALGFHGLFEGISLGIQSNARNILFLLLAISLHKWAAALSLGISFVKFGVNKKEFIIIILIFSFITPIGIIIGMVLTNLSNDILVGIFLSISVGTFIYISCSEILMEVFSKSENKFSKFLCFLLGGFVIIFLSVLEHFNNESHIKKETFPNK